MIKEIIDITEKVMIIRPVQTCEKFMSEQEIYEWTRGAWRLGAVRIKKVEYVFCVPKSEIIKVYKVMQWYRAGTLEYKYRNKKEFMPRTRWEFEGKIDEVLQEKYQGMSVAKYFPHGTQNPIRYINC